MIKIDKQNLSISTEDFMKLNDQQVLVLILMELKAIKNEVKKMQR